MVTSDALASALAEALQDHALRVALRNDLRASRWVEHKLPLQEYLHGDIGQNGALLADAIQSTSVWTSAGLPEVESALAQIQPLEIYMPVRTFRTTWTPSRHVAVAANFTREHELRADATILVHLPGGTSVRVPYWTDYSLDVAPIGIAPREADFNGDRSLRRSSSGTQGGGLLLLMAECDPEAIECQNDGGGGGGTTTRYDITYWGAVNTNADYDGWLQGDGEWSIWATSNSTSQYLCSFHNNIQEGVAQFGPTWELMYSHGAVWSYGHTTWWEYELWEEDGGAAPCTNGARDMGDTYIGTVYLNGTNPYGWHEVIPAAQGATVYFRTDYAAQATF